MGRFHVVALVLAGVAFGAVVAAGSGGTAAGCTLAGSWVQSTPGSGSSTWVITASGEATELGLGNATGKATLSGRTLKIDWTTSSGWSGYYQWTLAADCTGSGRLVFTAGARAGESLQSTVRGPTPNSGDSSTTARFRNEIYFKVDARRSDRGNVLRGISNARLSGFGKIVGLERSGTSGRWSWADLANQPVDAWFSLHLSRPGREYVTLYFSACSRRLPRLCGGPAYYSRVRGNRVLRVPVYAAAPPKGWCQAPASGHVQIREAKVPEASVEACGLAFSWRGAVDLFIIERQRVLRR